jgi:hypothetical protein
MIVAVSTSGLKRAKWYEFLLRFVLGGAVTSTAGILAKKFGPSFGGLFLAFPAILAASATLVEKHERRRKEKKGMGACTAAGMPRARTPLAPLWAALAWRRLQS